MQLSSIILARALAYIETFDIDPRGTIFYPELVPELVARYHFEKFPKSFEDFDESKGVGFNEGRFNKVVIQKFTIYNTLCTVETRSNTSDSREVLSDMLKWVGERFKLPMSLNKIRHWAYVSGVSFTSEIDILSLEPLATLAQKTGEAVTKIWNENITYYPVGLATGIDPLTRKYGIAGFTFQRRLEAPFAEKKYYSEAPLPTDTHIKFIEEYEADVRRLNENR